MSETVKEHKSKAPSKLNFALIMCSTSRYRKIERGESVSDPSSELIGRILKEHGYRIVMRRLVPDDYELIRDAVKEAVSSRDVDVILTCGGTGVSPLDITIETVKPLLEKELEGFGDIFRMISYKEIGSAAIMTRTLAGVLDGKVIFCLPGSPNAVALALKELILKEAGHIIKHLREK